MGTTGVLRHLAVTGILVLLIHNQIVVDAATTGRKPAPVSSITSSNNNKGRRVMVEAFENAGKAPGLEIWRIENFQPVAYPKKDYGKFYSGDSYIVLYTKQNKNGDLSWDLHFWLGRETSQDEAGAAAIMTVHLDDQLGGAPVQYREVQEHESQVFLSHFKNGVRYQPGGVSSGFTHVDRNAFEKRLFQVKGKRNIRVKQVDATVASMNKGDCFILDVGRDIYVYVGQKSKRVERLKATSAANLIRDQDHAGRARVHIIDEASPDTEIEEYFTKLGSGSPAEVPDESAGGDDQEFESSQERTVTLYRVSDASGKVDVSKIGTKPLQQAALDTNDCFILDTTDSNIYVWIGKKCNNREKGEAMNRAQQFLVNEHYPSWTQVQRIVEGAEPSIFQQYFQTWRLPSQQHSRLIRAVDDTPQVIKSAGEAPEFMPDDGSGEVEIFRVENFELEPVEPENYGKFFGGDSYVVKYSYGSKYIIYMWQGKNSSIDEKAASAIHAVRLDNELGGRATQIRLTQDHENKHFLHIFKGNMIIFLGGHSSGFKTMKDYDSYVEGETRLFRVRGTSEENVRAVQLPAEAKNLESDDVFLVLTQDKTYIWQGNDSSEVERSLAAGFVEKLAPESESLVVDEGEEPDEFWEALGGKEAYGASFEENLKALPEPRLFHARIVKGKVTVEEIDEFEQRDLSEDDVMILDAGSVVYIWVGNGATDDEKTKTFDAAQRYLNKVDRDDTVIVAVDQGEESESFTSLFSSWDPDLWETLTSYSDMKARIEEQNNAIEDDDDEEN